MFVLSLCCFHTTDTCAPLTISVNNNHHCRPLQQENQGREKKGIKERMTYCLDDRASVIASKETCLFVSTLTLPNCALSRIDTMPHHDSRQPMHTNPTSHTPPQPADQSEVAACLPCVAVWHRYHLALLLSVLPWAPSGLYAVGVRGVTVHLLYSRRFMSAPQRTGQRARERNA